MDKISRRIDTEIKNLVKPENRVEGITITPRPGNFRYFDIQIIGPSNTPYAGGEFNLELFLPADYPMVPPKAYFVTRIYHPNVDEIGRICLDILSDKWSPALQINKVALSLQMLLCSPNPEDPLDNKIADLWKKDNKKALENAKEWTRKFAGPNNKKNYIL